MAHMCLQTTESSHLNNRGHGTTCWEYLLLCRVFCLVTQSCLTFWDPIDCSLPDSSVHRDSLGKNTGVGCHALLQRLFPTHGLNPGLPDCEWILYCLESSGKPENTGAGSLSLLQGILPTQESNQGLLHCRRTLYQLSYKCWWRAYGIRVLSVTTWQMKDLLLSIMVVNLRWETSRHGACFSPTVFSCNLVEQHV